MQKSSFSNADNYHKKDIKIKSNKKVKTYSNPCQVLALYNFI